jgi:hypothetical protein
VIASICNGGSRSSGWNKPSPWNPLQTASYHRTTPTHPITGRRTDFHVCLLASQWEHPCLPLFRNSLIAGHHSWLDVFDVRLIAKSLCAYRLKIGFYNLARAARGFWVKRTKIPLGSVARRLGSPLPALLPPCQVKFLPRSIHAHPFGKQSISRDKTLGEILEKLRVTPPVSHPKIYYQ